jgi:hypothetical protein
LSSTHARTHACTHARTHTHAADVCAPTPVPMRGRPPPTSPAPKRAATANTHPRDVVRVVGPRPRCLQEAHYHAHSGQQKQTKQNLQTRSCGRARARRVRNDGGTSRSKQKTPGAHDDTKQRRRTWPWHPNTSPTSTSSSTTAFCPGDVTARVIGWRLAGRAGTSTVNVPLAVAVTVTFTGAPPLPAVVLCT